MKMKQMCRIGFVVLMAMISWIGFAQKPELKFNADKKFKIVQFTDLHVKWQDPKSDLAFERINQVLDDEQPDWVIFTGDIIYSEPALENMRNVLQTVSKREIPFSIVFGNHDDEQGASREDLLKVAMNMPYSVTEDESPVVSGVGNYVLPIRSSDGQRDAALLYCFDSNSYSQIEGVEGYDFIKPDQIAWYNKTSETFTQSNAGNPLPALAFFHIPLPEFNQAAMDEGAQMYGIRRERACSPALNTGLFAAFKQNKDVMGLFVGHDHDNDYAVSWHNVLLAYGRYTGGPTEYNHLPNGARVIELTEDSRTFRTWIRTKSGVEQETTFPNDYQKN